LSTLAIGLLALCFILAFIAFFFSIKKSEIQNLSILENSRFKQKLEALEVQNLSLNEDKTRLESRNIENEKELGILNTRLEEQNSSLSEKINFLKESKEELNKEFKLLANQILEDNSKKFSESNTQNLNMLLNPFKEQIVDFRKKVEDAYDKESKDRTELSTQIKSLKDLNIQISEEALRLTNALKGENKTQGTWGEMILEKVLQSSGLRENHEYKKELVLSDENNNRFRPDVLVSMPNNRDIIIDAKTSLNAYERYVNENDENKKENFLSQHLKSLHEHIKGLGAKSYENLKGINTLDFIFMFIPIEGALSLALENKPSIYDEAFKQHIVLVSPNTLLVALKAIENTWRYEKQAQNIKEVAKRAENLYAKFYNFIKDLEDIGKAVKTADKKYEDAYKKLSTGKGNILRQIDVFKEKASINPKNTINCDTLELEGSSKIVDN